MDTQPMKPAIQDPTEEQLAKAAMKSDAVATEDEPTAEDASGHLKDGFTKTKSGIVLPPMSRDGGKDREPRTINSLIESRTFTDEYERNLRLDINLLTGDVQYVSEARLSIPLVDWRNDGKPLRHPKTGQMVAQRNPQTGKMQPILREFYCDIVVHSYKIDEQAGPYHLFRPTPAEIKAQFDRVDTVVDEQMEMLREKYTTEVQAEVDAVKKSWEQHDKAIVMPTPQESKKIITGPNG